jgi:thiol-disulfide isomerase/thioredoxin
MELFFIINNLRVKGVLIFTLLLLNFTVNNVFAGDGGYELKIQIKGIEDTVCYLANYYGDKTYLTDTALVDAKGKFVFEGDSVLPGGVYIIAGQSNNKYFECIVDKDQRFSIVTDLSDISGKAKISNSHDNKLFFQYIERNIDHYKKIEVLKQKKAVLKDQPDSLLILNEKIELATKDLKVFQQNLISDNPESFVSVLLKAMTEPEIPEKLNESDGSVDSVFKYQYYKNHYWDNFDLSDDRLLRTPLFNKHIERFFTQVVYQHPDSIIKEADIFIDKTRQNKEVFKYSVWFLTYKFETSKIMGFDEIFVHMVDTYYSNGEAYWADSTVVKTLAKRADELRTILIGNIAPNLILIDTAGGFKSLHHTTAKYLVLLFYEIDCNHCKKEIKALKTWHEEDKYGVEVFAVCTDTSMVKWKKFINEYELDWIHVNGTRSVTPDYHDLYDIRTTPTLFLLDDKKKILAKRFKTEQLAPFLKNFVKTKEPN